MLYSRTNSKWYRFQNYSLLQNMMRHPWFPSEYVGIKKEASYVFAITMRTLMLLILFECRLSKLFFGLIFITNTSLNLKYRLVLTLPLSLSHFCLQYIELVSCYFLIYQRLILEFILSDSLTNELVKSLRLTIYKQEYQLSHFK